MIAGSFQLFIPCSERGAPSRQARSSLHHRFSPFPSLGIQGFSLGYAAENSYVPSIEFSTFCSSGGQHLAQILFCLPTIGLWQFSDSRPPSILSETFDLHGCILRHLRHERPAGCEALCPSLPRRPIDPRLGKRAYCTSGFHLSGNACQFRRSTQHLHEVYSPESENLKSV